MKDPLMDPVVFKWFITVMTMLGVLWVMVDVIRIRHLKTMDMTVPENRDKRFAWVIGIGIGLCVTYGVLKYHGVA